MDAGRPRSPWWNHLRFREIEALRDKRPAVLIPLGSCEQHSYHLPIDTDTYAVRTVCERAALLGREVPILVADVCAVGFSPHHMSFPGAITLKLETFLAVVRDAVESIHHHGFDRIIIVNGHGGNIAPLFSVATELTTRGKPVAVVLWWHLIQEECRRLREGPLPLPGHACELETSVGLYLRPDAVDMKAALSNPNDTMPYALNLQTDFLREYGATFPPVFTRASHGLHGDPTPATAEKGRQIVEAVARRLAELAEKYARAELVF